MYWEIINSVFQSDLVDTYAKCGHTCLLNQSQKLIQKIPHSDICASTPMITGYAQNGLLDMALELLNEMPQRNLVSWNAMIPGFAETANGEETLHSFRQM